MAQQPAVDHDVSRLLTQFDFAFVISNPRLPDNPIIHASQGFYEVTGYTQEEVLGRNCRFLQGPETSRQKVMEIRDAVREDRACQVCMVNYKKSGEKFYNLLFMAPIKDSDGVVELYVGIQTDVTQSVLKSLGGDSAAAANLEGLRKRLPVLCEGVAHLEQQESPELGFIVQKLDEMQQQEPSVPRRVSLDSRSHVLHQGSGGLAASSRSSSSSSTGSLQHVDSGPATAPYLPSSLLCPLSKIQQSFVLADPNQPDTPIVHASERFLELTGYPREEVVGRNCRFLQGPGTDPAEVARMREALHGDEPRPVTVRLLNHKYDGTPFWNSLHVAPVRCSTGKVVFFVGVQLDVTLATPAESAAAAARATEAPPADAGAMPEAGPVGMKHKLAQKGVVGAVRVALRSLSSGGLRRSIECQHVPRVDSANGHRETV